MVDRPRWPGEAILLYPAHCYLVHGIFNTGVGALATALKPRSTTHATLQMYATGWTWPKRLRGKAATG
eukprot:9528788-Alexandrium_andersonii.AAC.1